MTTPNLPFISSDFLLTIGLPYNEPNLLLADFADIALLDPSIETFWQQASIGTPRTA
jgi:hypothetical protein